MVLLLFHSHFLDAEPLSGTYTIPLIIALLWPAEWLETPSIFLQGLFVLIAKQGDFINP